MSDSEPSPLAVGPWRRRSRVVAYANPWIEVVHDEVDQPDGSPGIYGVVHFRNVAVGVVAVDDEGRLLLVGQHRYALDAYSWEIPAGGAPLDEDPLVGARRELAEETGYESSAWQVLARFSLSNSVTDERGVLFLATGLRAGMAAPEPSEELALRWASLDDVLARIASGEIHDILTITGVTRYALQLREAGTKRGNRPPTSEQRGTRGTPLTPRYPARGWLGSS
ncbi:MAG: NUDIX hydrolase [Propionibacteriaceae bacterium]